MKSDKKVLGNILKLSVPGNYGKMYFKDFHLHNKNNNFIVKAINSPVCMKNILLIDYGATRVKSISVALTKSNPDSREFSSKGSSFLGCRIDNKFFLTLLLNI